MKDFYFIQIDVCFKFADDFHGDCDIDDDTFVDFKPVPGVTLNIPKRYNANYPLLRTINEATVLALDEIAQEALLPSKDKDNEIPHGPDENGKGAATNPSQNSLFVICVALCLHLLRNN